MTETCFFFKIYILNCDASMLKKKNNWDFIFLLKWKEKKTFKKRSKELKYAAEIQQPW